MEHNIPNSAKFGILTKASVWLQISVSGPLAPELALQNQTRDGQNLCSSYCCPSKLERPEKQHLKRIHLLQLFQLLTGKQYSKHILTFDVKELSIINSDVAVSPFSPG